ncbi:LacI family DNA-binding transcriptional regulator [Paenibacillus sp. sgz500958]|uniref:LacI family DNA-binding transcriptional regulator n=1 Tax=Paenibacillus sp. sgz500958 TaxID=3242475 RepID=UPI0036D3DAE0
MKKATMKDIARLANVSVATVSYVLNNVQKQTIPEATKVNILQIAKELNYVPNLAARSLVLRKTGLVGILINRTADTPYWKQQNHSTFISGLEAKLTEAGYHTLLVSLNPDNPYLDVIRERKLDAVFLIDVKEEQFYRISANFTEGVPLILIDSLISDPLFNQVYFNYPGALDQARSALPLPACLVMESFNNAAFMDAIISGASLPGEQIYVVKGTQDLSDLCTFLKQNQGKHMIVTNEFLGKIIENSYTGPVTVLCTCDLPQILDNTTATVQFADDRSRTSFELMETLMQNHGGHAVHQANQFWVDVLK